MCLTCCSEHGITIPASWRPIVCEMTDCYLAGLEQHVGTICEACRQRLYLWLRRRGFPLDRTEAALIWITIQKSNITRAVASGARVTQRA